MKAICVFCGSNAGGHPIYAEAARKMGTTLAERNITLVYGGGKIGLMGELARAVLGANGRVVGVIPKALLRKELAYEDLTELHVVESMHARKALMAERSDAFVAMPGGYGTFEEFCEVLTWAQLGFHVKPVALFNVNGYYDPLLALFDHAVQEKFVKPMHREMVIAESDAAALLDRMGRYAPPTVEKWLDVSST